MPALVAVRGVSQRGGASRCGSESAARVQASDRGRIRPSRSPVRQQDPSKRERRSRRPYVVEVLTWKDSDVPDNAPPEVRAIWKDLESLCEKRGEHPGIEIDEVELVTGDPPSS